MAERSKKTTTIATWQQISELGDKLYDEGKLPLIEMHILRPTAFDLYDQGFQGLQKSVVIGDTRRARLSSQCRERLARLCMMKKNQGGRAIAFVELFQHYLIDDQYGMDIVISLIDSLMYKDGRLSQPIDIYKYDFEETVSVIKEAEKEFPEGSENALSKATAYVAKVLKADAPEQPMTFSTALFGRMAADNTFSTSVYSATHLNHAYSINPYIGYKDDYTSTDDFLMDHDEFGMEPDDMSPQVISTYDYYEYTNIDTLTMFENLMRGRSLDEADALLKAEKEYVVEYLEQMIISVPSTKITSMVSFRPAIVYITTSVYQPAITMDNAFQTAVYGNEGMSTIDHGAERMKHWITNDEHRPNPIIRTGRYWLSDVYSAPDGVTSITLSELNKLFE